MTEQTGNNKPNEAEGLAFPLSGNEKLIEEARRAKRAVYLATDASVADDLSRIIGGLADALEAAEEALTPTEDERKAIAQVILPVFDQLASAVYGDGPYSEAESALEAADLLIAAGFRRSEVPETAPELFPGTLDALDSLTIRKEEA